MTLYNIFVDPAFVKDKPRFISIVAPLLYEHLCQINGFDKVEKERCIKNLEMFTKKSYLPIKPSIMYYGQNISSGNIENFDRTGYNNTYNDIMSGMTKDKIEEEISMKLDEMIKVGERKYNYLGYFSDVGLIQALKSLNQSHIYIYQNNYVFIEPRALSISESRAIKDLENILI